MTRIKATAPRGPGFALSRAQAGGARAARGGRCKRGPTQAPLPAGKSCPLEGARGCDRATQDTKASQLVAQFRIRKGYTASGELRGSLAILPRLRKTLRGLGAEGCGDRARVSDIRLIKLWVHGPHTLSFRNRGSAPFGRKRVTRRGSQRHQNGATLLTFVMPGPCGLAYFLSM